MIVRPGEWAAHAPKDANDAIRQPGGEGWRLVPRMLDEATMVGHERIQVRGRVCDGVHWCVVWCVVWGVGCVAVCATVLFGVWCAGCGDPVGVVLSPPIPSSS